MRLLLVDTKRINVKYFLSPRSFSNCLHSISTRAVVNLCAQHYYQQKKLQIQILAQSRTHAVDCFTILVKNGFLSLSFCVSRERVREISQRARTAFIKLEKRNRRWCRDPKGQTERATNKLALGPEATLFADDSVGSVFID